MSEWQRLGVLHDHIVKLKQHVQDFEALRKELQQAKLALGHKDRELRRTKVALARKDKALNRTQAHLDTTRELLDMFGIKY